MNKTLLASKRKCTLNAPHILHRRRFTIATVVRYHVQFPKCIDSQIDVEKLKTYPFTKLISII